MRRISHPNPAAQSPRGKGGIDRRTRAAGNWGKAPPPGARKNWPWHSSDRRRQRPCRQTGTWETGTEKEGVLVWDRRHLEQWRAAERRHDKTKSKGKTILCIKGSWIPSFATKSCGGVSPWRGCSGWCRRWRTGRHPWWTRPKLSGWTWRRAGRGWNCGHSAASCW